MWCKKYEQEMQGPLPTDAATMHRKPPVNIHRLVTAIYFCGGWAGECHSEDNLQELIFSFPLWGLRLREDAFSCGLSLSAPTATKAVLPFSPETHSCDSRSDLRHERRWEWLPLMKTKKARVEFMEWSTAMPRAQSLMVKADYCFLFAKNQPPL